ncbi:MAG: haloacid dehalogenase-like hydrolase [Myxococcales bacterium]|nr:haloacid dehalogenase-like hydrolase [Myxococcales bacterium]
MPSGQSNPLSFLPASLRAPLLDLLHSASAKTASAGPVPLSAARRGDVPVAAFDADGTLWGVDVSDELLEWVDARGLVTRPSGAQSLKSWCDELCRVERAKGYAWAAAAYAGHPADEVAEWADAAFEATGRAQIHPQLAELVAVLQAAGVCVLVVSASPVWAVLPGARHLGIPDENVLAIEVEREVVGGRVRLTDRVRAPVTSSQGKVARIEDALGRAPFFAAGNTIDDLPMIEFATTFRLVVDPRPPHGAGTADVGAIAAERGYPVLLTGALAAAGSALGAHSARTSAGGPSA